MSQEGNTLLYQPSSATAHFNSHQTMNTTSVPPRAAAVVPADHHSSDEEKGGGKAGGAGGKSRRELPAGAVATLKAWLLSPEHFTHPYPTPQDQIMLMHKTGIDKKQLKNWFTNARRRIWKPMLKKQLEAGKLAAAGGVVTAPIGAPVGMATGGMSVAVPPGLGVTVPPPELSPTGHQQQQQQAPRQEMFSNFQQAQQMPPGDPNQMQQYQQQPQQQQQYQQQQVQYDQNGQIQQQQQPMYDQFGNQVYDQNYQQQYQQPPEPQQQQQQHTPNPMNNVNNQHQFPLSNSIGSLAPLNPTSGGGSMASFGKMIKTDSHAVLMELFARDQDLVRQAAGKGGASVQAAAAGQAPPGLGNNNNNNVQPNNATSSLQASGNSGTLRWANGTASPSNMGQKQHSVTFEGVTSLSSWPHFSSVSSLNNLGGLQGVKSITNLSMADLSSQGNLNKMGNLAQVKSIENLGRGDSFAFLEVFFDDKSGLTNSTHSNGQRGIKREREDDDAIGLSLEDDGTSLGQQFKPPAEPAPAEAGAPTPAPLPEDGSDNIDGTDAEGGKLKRAYDDALAARGLIAVRRSCEKLTDLALPAKMQRTLSQEYIRQHNQGQPMGDFFSTNNSAYAPNNNRNNSSSQQLHQQYPQQTISMDANGDPTIGNASSIEVPYSTKCALCTTTNVDTQLRPCGHMFHGRCLKPSLQNATGPPQCPMCNTPMQSAILAVPSAAGSDGGTNTAGVGGGAVNSTATTDGSMGGQ